MATKQKRTLYTNIKNVMIQKVPAYGNKFFYSLGFLSAIAFVMLVGTGIIMNIGGAHWWLTNSFGGYVRSVHLWSTQAFVLFIILHLLVVFSTSAYKKPRQWTWVLGVLMLFFVLAETEFGYILRGDFSSQWRSLQGADFYNGAGLGNTINALYTHQIHNIHIFIVPIIIGVILTIHYTLVRTLGIAKPYRKDVKAPVVAADHTKLFMRGGVVAVLILVLALILPSPYLKPTSLQQVAQQDPALMTRTFALETTRASDTATYVDNIAPYTLDTRLVYVTGPYSEYVSLHPGAQNDWRAFISQPAATQTAQLATLSEYYGQDQPDPAKAPTGPLMNVLTTLTDDVAAGQYQPVTQTDSEQVTYSTRLLADTGVLDAKAQQLNITTEQYGMVREETGRAPGAWWLTPIGVLNHTVLSNDDNGDRDAAIIFGSLLLTIAAFPFIPYVNQIPDRLKLYKPIWGGKKSNKK